MPRADLFSVRGFLFIGKTESANPRLVYKGTQQGKFVG